MDQITFSEAEYQTKKRKTRREIFLERMEKLIPWAPVTCCTVASNACSVMPVILGFKSGMSIRIAKTSPSSLPNGLAPGRNWMPTS